MEHGFNLSETSTYQPHHVEGGLTKTHKISLSANTRKKHKI